MKRLLPAAAERDRGFVIPIVALLLPVLILMVAFAIDLGIQRSNRRTMQARADIIALDLVRLTDGRTEEEILIDPSFTVAFEGSKARNDIPADVTVLVEYGRWEQSTGFQRTDFNQVPNAVEVVASQEQDYFFQPGSGTVSRTAIAAEEERAQALLGTRLVSVSSLDAELLNDVFAAALCPAAPAPPTIPPSDPPAPPALSPCAATPPLSLTALDYEGLIGASLDLGALAAELGFGSPDEMADATIDGGEFFRAGAQVLQNQGNEAAANVFQGFAAEVEQRNEVVDGPPQTVEGPGLFKAEQGGNEGVITGGVDAFSLLTASAFAINGTSTIGVPSLNVALPGVTGVSLALDVTERPKTICCRLGDFAFARQAGLALTLSMDTEITTTPDLPLDPPSDPPLPLPSDPPPPALPGTLLRVVGTAPLEVLLAGGRGVITDIDCGAPLGGPRSLQVSLEPRPVTSTMTMDLSIQTVGGTEVARASGIAAGATTQGTSNDSTFLYADEFLPTVGTGTMRAANPTTLGLANSASATSGNLTVNGMPVGLNPIIVPSVPPTTVDPAAVAASLNAELNTLLVQLDDLIVNRLGTLLGLNIGGADIGAQSMNCRAINLVG